MNTILQALAEVEKNNESAALCTVVKSIGSTPRHVGSKMLVYPDGKSEILLKVPRYDFNWQHTYDLAEPKRIPAGTVWTYAMGIEPEVVTEGMR